MKTELVQLATDDIARITRDDSGRIQHIRLLSSQVIEDGVRIPPQQIDLCIDGAKALEKAFTEGRLEIFKHDAKEIVDDLNKLIEATKKTIAELTNTPCGMYDRSNLQSIVIKRFKEIEENINRLGASSLRLDTED